jgi:hypothetical protein
MRLASITSCSAVSRSTRPIERRLDRQVELDLLRDLDLLARRRALLRVRARLLFGDDVDPVLGQVLVQLDDLLARWLDVLERRRQLLRREVTALASFGDDVAQLVDFGERHLREQRGGDVGQ